MAAASADIGIGSSIEVSPKSSPSRPSKPKSADDCEASALHQPGGSVTYVVSSTTLRASLPVISSATSSSSGTQRHVLDEASLEKALEFAARCGSAERQGPVDCRESTWAQCEKLRSAARCVFGAQPDSSLPAHFQKAMDTCVVCLLHSPEGHLQRASQMLHLLDSPDAGPVLRYLEWLEPALREVSPARGASYRTVLVPQRVRSALSSWPAECDLLRQNATALWEALLSHAPIHLRGTSERKRCEDARQAMQEAQTQEAARIAKLLQAASSEFDDQLQDERNQEWPKLAETSQVALQSIQQLASTFLAERQESLASSLEEYEALGAQIAASSAEVVEARRQVRRHEQALGQTLQRFTELASQLVAWTSVLVPKLRLLEKHKGALRAAVDLQSQLPVLEREKIEAEDEVDAASTDLRKHRRHASASRQRPAAQIASTETVTSAVIEKQFELRQKHAEERVRQLTSQLKEAERLFDEAVAKLPLAIVPEDSLPCRRETSPEERLALKVAELQDTHETVALQVSEVQAECDRVLTQVATRRDDEALRRRIEPDFMCPIMHERMIEPVLAADGHTYERQAIERWLQMHNTSPMTGAPLAHRYLTENFALRHVIASYEADLPKDDVDVAEDEDEDLGDSAVSVLSEGDGEDESDQ